MPERTSCWCAGMRELTRKGGGLCRPMAVASSAHSGLRLRPCPREIILIPAHDWQDEEARGGVGMQRPRRRNHFFYLVTARLDERGHFGAAFQFALPFV